MTEAEREFEQGRREWQVDVVDDPCKHDAQVANTSGAITHTDVDRANRDRDDRWDD